MDMHATTTAPAEVKRLFDEYASVLDMYASDQRAMMTRFKTGKKERELRARIYDEIAAEMRAIEFKASEPRELTGQEREAFLINNGYKE